MDKIQKIIQQIAIFLGLAKPPPPPPAPPTELELFKEKYTTVAAGDRVKFLNEEYTRLQGIVTQSLQSLANQRQEVVLTTSPLYIQVVETLHHVETLLFAAREKDRLANTAQTEDAEEIDVLQDITKVLLTLSVPGKQWTEKLETYIQKFEEPLLFAEARGEYKFLTSENKLWVKLPLLQFLGNKKSGSGLAEKELQQFFYDCSELQYLELGSRVPMTPTSLVDVEMQIASKRVVPVYIAAGKDIEWYLLVTE